MRTPLPSLLALTLLGFAFSAHAGDVDLAEKLQVTLDKQCDNWTMPLSVRAADGDESTTGLTVSVSFDNGLSLVAGDGRCRLFAPAASKVLDADGSGTFEQVVSGVVRIGDFTVADAEARLSVVDTGYDYTHEDHLVDVDLEILDLWMLAPE